MKARLYLAALFLASSLLLTGCEQQTPHPTTTVPERLLSQNLIKACYEDHENFVPKDYNVKDFCICYGNRVFGGVAKLKEPLTPELEAKITKGVYAFCRDGMRPLHLPDSKSYIYSRPQKVEN